MNPLRSLTCLVVLPVTLSICDPTAGTAQGTLADYLRADSLGDRTQGLVVDMAERPSWIGESNRFWYRKSVEGGNSFVLVDAVSQAKGPAFDHERLAATLSGLHTFAEDSVTAVNLPFNRFEFTEDGKAVAYQSGRAGNSDVYAVAQ